VQATDGIEPEFPPDANFPPPRQRDCPVCTAGVCSNCCTPAAGLRQLGEWSPTTLRCVSVQTTGGLIEGKSASSIRANRIRRKP
jgi:hypothetical protein